MKRILAAILLAALILGVGACAGRLPPKSAKVDPNNLIYVAVINPETADHVRDLLKRAGIQSVIEGSVVYGVAVPSGTESRAIAVLKSDSAKQKYWIRLSSNRDLTLR